MCVGRSARLVAVLARIWSLWRIPLWGGRSRQVDIDVRESGEVVVGELPRSVHFCMKRHHRAGAATRRDRRQPIVGDAISIGLGPRAAASVILVDQNAAERGHCGYSPPRKAVGQGGADARLPDDAALIVLTSVGSASIIINPCRAICSS